MNPRFSPRTFALTMLGLLLMARAINGAELIEDVQDPGTGPTAVAGHPAGTGRGDGAGWRCDLETSCLALGDLIDQGNRGKL